MQNLSLFDGDVPVARRRFRLLHTSDWHLGQHFFGRTRHAEHEAFCRWLVAQVRQHEVDAVIVAGDLFDTGTPPSYARELYNRVVLDLRASGTRLVLLGGNHDSVAMLDESQALLAALDTHVIAARHERAEEQLLVLPGRDGKPGAVICAIPFLRPRDLMKSEAGQSAVDKQRSLQTAIHAHYAELFALAESRRLVPGRRLPVVATGHLTTVGASAGESVREIYVGALEAFPTDAFPPADYIALGHIHRPQTVGGREHIRYSGSPIPLAFDEANQAKQVLLVDFEEGELARIEPLAVPCFQPLVSLRGSLETLRQAFAEHCGGLAEGQRVWVEVVVDADEYLSDLHSRIAALSEDLPVDVLRIRRERGVAAATLQAEAAETLEELDPNEVFERRLAGESLDDPARDRLQGLYRQVLDELFTPD